MLSDVFIDHASGKVPVLPMLIANTTMTPNYMLVPFTPDRLEHWGVRQYTETHGTDHFYPSKEKNYWRFLQNIPLASGIKASSSVPGFIGPSVYAANRDNIPYRLQLEDGGIVDNQGLYTVKTILNHEKRIVDPKKRIVIVIDPARSGIDAKRSADKNGKRKKSIFGIATSATPDAQYALMREKLTLLEKENNCTVIYLGTEALLDPALGRPGSMPDKFTFNKKSAESMFYEMYKKMRNDPNYSFAAEASRKDRAMLYEYIRSKIKTWFSAKGSNYAGRYREKVDDVKGYSKIMFLAGRAVVQLRQKEIQGVFSH